MGQANHDGEAWAEDADILQKTEWLWSAKTKWWLWSSSDKNIWESIKSNLVAIERRAAVAKIWPRRKRPAPTTQSRRRTWGRRNWKQSFVWISFSDRDFSCYPQDQKNIEKHVEGKDEESLDKQKVPFWAGIFCWHIGGARQKWFFFIIRDACVGQADVWEYLISSFGADGYLWRVDSKKTQKDCTKNSSVFLRFKG